MRRFTLANKFSISKAFLEFRNEKHFLMTNTKKLLKSAENLLDAAELLSYTYEALNKPLLHHQKSLEQAMCSVLEVLSSVFGQLSLHSNGGTSLNLFYKKCEPFSVNYLRAYLKACIRIVKQHQRAKRKHFPYDSMCIRAQTLRCLLLEKHKGGSV